MTPAQLTANWSTLMGEWNRMPQSTVRTIPTVGKQAALDAHASVSDFTKRLVEVFCLNDGIRVLSLDRSGSMGDIPTRPIKKHHPEQGDDEIFMGNTVPDKCHIGWKTKRFGKYAYNAYGKLITNNEYVPAFIKKQEVREALADPKIDADRRRVWEKMLVEGQ